MRTLTKAIRYKFYLILLMMYKEDLDGLLTPALKYTRHLSPNCGFCFNIKSLLIGNDFKLDIKYDAIPVLVPELRSIDNNEDGIHFQWYTNEERIASLKAILYPNHIQDCIEIAAMINNDEAYWYNAPANNKARQASKVRLFGSRYGKSNSKLTDIATS